MITWGAFRTFFSENLWESQKF